MEAWCPILPWRKHLYQNLPDRTENQKVIIVTAIYMLFFEWGGGGGGGSVLEDTMPEVLTTAWVLRLRAELETKGTAFSYTDRPWPVNRVLIVFWNSSFQIREKKTRKKDMTLEKHQIASFRIFHHVRVFTNIFARFWLSGDIYKEENSGP